MTDVAIDMTGFRSGKLVAIAKAPGRLPRTYWLCRCDCGNYHIVMGKYLRYQSVKSCGCLNRKPLAGYAIKHGHARTGTAKISPTYLSWIGMVQRCFNPNAANYRRYGAIGRTVCARLLKFENFLADLGERPPGKSIDRIENKGHYSCGKCEQCIANNWPMNCRWATPKEQARSFSRMITFRGKTQSLSDWSKETGISRTHLDRRLKKWSVEKALTTPVTQRSKS